MDWGRGRVGSWRGGIGEALLGSPGLGSWKGGIGDGLLGSSGLGSWKSGIGGGWDWRRVGLEKDCWDHWGWDYGRVGLEMDCWDHQGWDHGRVGLEAGGIEGLLGSPGLGSWKGGIGDGWDWRRIFGIMEGWDR